MEYINSLKWRYATKKFDKHKILDGAVVDRILEAASLTPTSLGFQPIKVLNVKSPFLRERIRGASFNQSQVTDASNLLILCVDADFSKDNVKKYINLVSGVRQVPSEKLVGFENMVNGWIDGLPDDEARITWAAKQAYITIGTMMAACAIEKIDSCPMEGFIPSQVAEVLELEKFNLFPVLMLPIGHRAEDCANQHLPKVRKPMNEYVINF